MANVKKRGAVYGVIGLMLCVALYLNWSYVQSPDELLVAGQVDSELAGVSSADPSAGNTDAANAAEEAEAVSGSD